MNSSKKGWGCGLGGKSMRTLVQNPVPPQTGERKYFWKTWVEGMRRVEIRKGWREEAGEDMDGGQAGGVGQVSQQVF
jgi:hypothetical protein